MLKQLGGHACYLWQSQDEDAVSWIRQLTEPKMISSNA